MEQEKQVITVSPIEGGFEVTCSSQGEKIWTATPETLDETIREVAEVALNRPGEDFAVNEFFTVVQNNPPVEPEAAPVEPEASADQAAE